MKTLKLITILLMVAFLLPVFSSGILFAQNEEPPTAIAVTVVDAAGQPVGGAGGNAWRFHEYSHGIWGFETDAYGQRTIVVRPGLFDISVWHPVRKLFGRVFDITVTEGETTEVNLTVEAHPGGYIDGQVVDAMEVPVEDIVIDVRNEEYRWWAHTRTDTDGHFRLSLPVGVEGGEVSTYEVTVRSPDWEEVLERKWVEVRATETTTIKVAILAAVVPTITLAPTSGPPGTEVTVTGVNFPFTAAAGLSADPFGVIPGTFFWTDEDGAFSLSPTILPDAPMGPATFTVTLGEYYATAIFTVVVGVVDISIQPPTKSVAVGETLTLDIRADAGTQPVTGISGFINFDTSKLEVLSITPGTALPTVMLNTYDNAAGTIDYSAGQQLGEPSPTGTFVVATIEFTALEETPATAVEFNQTAPRKTMADFGGTDVTGMITGEIVAIIYDTPIFLTPPSTSVFIGQTFALEIKTSVDNLQPVTGVAAFINFEASKLEVLSITPGATLDVPLLDDWDNAAGTVDYSAGKLTAPFPTGSFVVATIKFKALAEAPGTSVTFNFADPRMTMVDFGGNAIPGTHANAAVEIIPEVAVDISMVLQGGARPDEGWEVPVMIKFFHVGADVLNDTPVKTFDVTPIKSADRAVAEVSIIPGTYDITVASETTLINVRRNVEIAPPAPVLDMGTLLEGNANGDHIINITDFGILAVSYMKAEGDEAFDKRADFDRNGIVNIADFGLLAVNFMNTSPVEIP